MCLVKVDWLHSRINSSKVEDEQIHEGYAVVRRTKAPTVFTSAFDMVGTRYRKGRWYGAEGKKPIIADDWNKYKPGFHIFQSANDAITYMDPSPSEALVKVQYKHILVFGVQSSTAHSARVYYHNDGVGVYEEVATPVKLDCVVAKYRKIVEVIKIQGASLKLVIK